MSRFFKSLRTRLETRRDRLERRRQRAAESDETADETAEAVPEPEPKWVITGTGRDYSDFQDNDKAIRLHVPESIRIALDELATLHAVSLSTLLRHVMFLYLYGRYDFVGQLERKDHRFHLVDQSHGAFYRPLNSLNRMPDLGKNNQDIKVFLPEPMHMDLKACAKARDIPLSVFTREVIAHYLFGHTELPERDVVEPA